MGLFQAKKPAITPAPQDDASAATAGVFDEAYRNELRAQGLASMKQIISENSDHFTKRLDETVMQTSSELQVYMTKQLDATLARIDSEMNRRLDERLAEHDRITNDAQDQAVQSLNRNAQALHEKYQQLSGTLQQTIVSQEAMMIGVFEENKSRMNTTQNAQETIIQSLRTSVQTTQDQAAQLGEALQQTLTAQTTAMNQVVEDNRARIATTSAAQEQALTTLTASVQLLQEQHAQLGALLEHTVANQEAMLMGVFTDNMAQIVEHYLLGALGDQFDMRAQMPLILKQMETNKQAIMDDMKL